MLEWRRVHNRYMFVCVCTCVCMCVHVCMCVCVSVCVRWIYNTLVLKERKKVLTQIMFWHSSMFGSQRVRHCDIATLRHCDIATLRHCDSATLRHCDIATLRHCDIEHTTRYIWQSALALTHKVSLKVIFLTRSWHCSHVP